MRVDALVLAGADNKGKLQAVSSCEYEALIAVNNEPMVSYVVRALQNTESVARIVVVGPAQVGEVIGAHIPIIAQGTSLADNIKRGVDYLETDKMVLVVTSDIPFINPEAIEDFLERCGDLDGDLFYPVVSKEANEKVFPNVERTYFQLREGVFTGGNVILIAPQVVGDCQEMMKKTVALRKKPVQLCRLLGLRFIIKFLMHTLSVAEIESRVKTLFSINGVVVISPYPEIGVDVDKPSDWQLAEDFLSRQVTENDSCATEQVEGLKNI